MNGNDFEKILNDCKQTIIQIEYLGKVEIVNKKQYAIELTIQKLYKLELTENEIDKILIENRDVMFDGNGDLR